jgi:hypothetical protein
MRVNNVKRGETLSPLLSDNAERVASFIIARGNAARAKGLNGSPWERKYNKLCAMARHKYPYRGPMPEWVSMGGLD